MMSFKFLSRITIGIFCFFLGFLYVYFDSVGDILELSILPKLNFGSLNLLCFV